MKKIFFEGPIFFNETYIFPKNALSALYRLKNRGFMMSFDMTHLHDEHQLLLMQEELITYHFPKEQADILVHAIDEKGNLEIKGDGYNEKVQTDDWMLLVDQIFFPSRVAHVERNTAETQISISLNLDGEGNSDINSGLKFLDHMLHQISKHGMIDLYVQCNGDLEIDEHHTIEDIAITLGKAILEAIGDKKGIERYSFHLPMDESRALVALDFSGRPFLEFEGDFKREYVGDFPTEMLKHFFYSLAMNMEATLHIKVEGENEHHKIEACFKGLAIVLKNAVKRTEESLGRVPSSKGSL